MARARNIKPGFYKNEDLAECSIWARFIFPGLWMLADREGRLEDRPKRIKAELLPFDGQDIEPLLRELHERGFLIRYRNEDGSFIQISKFSSHQSPHYSEKQSAIKPPLLPESDQPEAGKTPGVLQERPEKVTPIKRGSQPPDSLNPDSLNPESLEMPSAIADPWNVGKEFLIARGISAKSAGSIIGKWAKEHGHPATIAALQAAIDGQVVEPVPYITAALQNRPGKKFDPVAYNARTA